MTDKLTDYERGQRSMRDRAARLADAGADNIRHAERLDPWLRAQLRAYECMAEQVRVLPLAPDPDKEPADG